MKEEEKNSLWEVGAPRVYTKDSNLTVADWGWKEMKKLRGEAKMNELDMKVVEGRDSKEGASQSSTV